MWKIYPYYVEQKQSTLSHTASSSHLIHSSKLLSWHYLPFLVTTFRELRHGLKLFSSGGVRVMKRKAVIRPVPLPPTHSQRKDTLWSMTFSSCFHNTDRMSQLLNSADKTNRGGLQERKTETIKRNCSMSADTKSQNWRGFFWNTRNNSLNISHW